jgi:NADH dehydrogenase [ubiquinone] 1 alpha subcomplex assembly factor 7
MQEVLTNPLSGYYMNKDVFGEKGDFVTSPEISQMFGECLSIWIMMEWRKMGQPRPLQLVELGPGRGTLMQDILRTVMNLNPESMSALSVHLVEVSPAMRRLQEARLCGSFHDHDEGRAKDALTKFGAPVFWHDSLESVPRGFSFHLAHEFFDALPVHQFTRTDDGWREVLVDVDEATEGLRFVRSRHTTPTAKALILPDDRRRIIEMSPKSGAVTRLLSDRIKEEGGSALIIDYGHSGEDSDSLRAFKGHQQQHPLKDPGTADVTADVDFAFLKRNCNEATSCYGPVEQGNFLRRLGIETRMQVLMANCKDGEAAADIASAFRMLTHEDQMGRRFKCMAIFPKTMNVIHEKYPPVGF